MSAADLHDWREAMRAYPMLRRFTLAELAVWIGAKLALEAMPDR